MRGYSKITTIFVFTMTLINKTKQGDCSRCPATNTAVRKRGRELVCLNCCKTEDVVKQMDNARKRNALRGDTSKVKKLGVEQCDRDIAERSAIIADIDREFSFYVRLREADQYGYTRCFTSGRRLHYLALDAGHYISRKYLATRWDADNVKPQSHNDNRFLDGNIEVFKQKLEEENKGITEVLYERSLQVWKPTISELKELLIHWREKAKLVKSKLK